MAARLRVLIDLNIILDVLQRQIPFFATSAHVLSCAETRQFEGMVAAHSLTTLFYLMRQYNSVSEARVNLTGLLTFLSVATVDQSVIEQALNLPYKDFEDAVQMMAAVRAGAQYVVTRNIRDYQAGPLTALQPSELLALL